MTLPIIKRFSTTTLREAEEFDTNDRGYLVEDLEDGHLYFVHASGSGAAIASRLLGHFGRVNVPLGAFIEVTSNTPLVAFANAADPTPGFSLDNSEAWGIRWNNHATPDPIVTSLMLPRDLDDAEDLVVRLYASKSGATVGDAVTWDVGAFFQTVGALHDADTNAGGASSAMDGDLTAKTVQECTRTIAAADVPAAPCVLTLTLQPTDGTLGTDDVTLHAVCIDYTRQMVVS